VLAEGVAGVLHQAFLDVSRRAIRRLQVAISSSSSDEEGLGGCMTAKVSFALPVEGLKVDLEPPGFLPSTTSRTSPGRNLRLPLILPAAGSFGARNESAAASWR